MSWLFRRKYMQIHLLTTLWGKIKTTLSFHLPRTWWCLFPSRHRTAVFFFPQIPLELPFLFSFPKTLARDSRALCRLHDLIRKSDVFQSPEASEALPSREHRGLTTNRNMVRKQQNTCALPVFCLLTQQAHWNWNSMSAKTQNYWLWTEFTHFNQPLFHYKVQILIHLLTHSFILFILNTYCHCPRPPIDLSTPFLSRCKTET